MRYPKGFTKVFRYNNLPIRARVIDAKQNVTTTRNADDAYAGNVADPERCMDANCVMRHAKSGTFPHPVLAVWVIKSMAYVLISARPGSKNRPPNYVVVRYRHHNWPLIKQFDKSGHMTRAERARKFGGEKKITFYVPGVWNKLGADTRKGRGGKRSARPTGRNAEPKGLNARFLSLRQWQENAELMPVRAMA